MSALTPSPGHSRSASLEGSTAALQLPAPSARHGLSLSGGRATAPLPPAASRRGASPAPMQRTAATGMTANASRSEDIVISAHPDAVRRRQQAEARRKERALQHQAAVAVTAAPPGAPPMDLPANAAYVVSLSDFRTAMALSATSSKLAVVFYSAPWCHACRSLYPKFKQIACNNPDVEFVQVNCEDEELRQHLANNLGLAKLPYFHLYRSGSLVSSFTASLTKVAMIRAEIAAHKVCAAQECEEQW